MSWIILIVAGLFESAFAFCLGKMKGQAGIEYYMWGAGFIVSLVMSMLLLATRCPLARPIPCGQALVRSVR